MKINDGKLALLDYTLVVSLILLIFSAFLFLVSFTFFSHISLSFFPFYLSLPLFSFLSLLSSLHPLYINFEFKEHRLSLILVCFIKISSWCKNLLYEEKKKKWYCCNFFIIIYCVYYLCHSNRHLIYVWYNSHVIL